MSRAVIEATMVRRESVIVRDSENEARLRTIQQEGILSAMAIPLGLSTHPVGLLYVDDRRKMGPFGSEDLAYLTALGHLVSAALESAERFQRIEAVAESLGATADIIGASDVMNRLRTTMTKYGAAGHTNVLIRGESGTGKELVARSLHEASVRSAKPFVTLNCAAIPESMLESELFGHEKGAFTGAIAKKRGKFSMADGGTLFLDEIGDLALPAQAKLLRALQEGEIQAVGAERAIHVDVRVVSATHKDLLKEIQAGRFREDLYYRLAVVEIDVPPLRERGDDVALISHALMRRSAGLMGKYLDGFTEAALSALARHSWPGNVRELRNEIERAVIHADGPRIDAHDLSPRLGAARPRPSELALTVFLTHTWGYDWHCRRQCIGVGQCFPGASTIRDFSSAFQSGPKSLYRIKSILRTLSQSLQQNASNSSLCGLGHPIEQRQIPRINLFPNGIRCLS